MNRIVIAGNLGQDPEMQYLSNGAAVTKFSVATNRVYYKDEEKITETTWFNVEVWGKKAENCNQYLSKGSKVAVDGRMACDQYEKDGRTVYYWKLVAQDVEFLDSREQQAKEPAF